MLLLYERTCIILLDPDPISPNLELELMLSLAEQDSGSLGTRVSHSNNDGRRVWRTTPAERDPKISVAEPFRF